MISERQKSLIRESLAPYKPKMIGIFGSYARGENSEQSDLDILVEFENTVNLLDIIELEINLSEALGIKVDLVTQKSLSPYLREAIVNDLQRIV